MNTWLETILLKQDAQAESKGNLEACIELVNLYRSERPLSALAFGMKAKRLEPDFELAPLQEAVERLRSSEWGTDPIGCYRLGNELASYPVDTVADTRKAVAFLKAAVEAKDSPCVGAAALSLADLLSSLGRTEAYTYYHVAEEHGFCDILPPIKPNAETSVA